MARPNPNPNPNPTLTLTLTRFALRNGAPLEVCQALAEAQEECRDIEQHFGRLEAFGHAQRALGSTHPKTRLVRSSARRSDMNPNPNPNPQPPTLNPHPSPSP